MNKKLKFDFQTMLILPIACLVALTGCSSIGGTGGHQWATTNLVTRIEQDQEKIENPRVRPGQPYDQGTWPLP